MHEVGCLLGEVDGEVLDFGDVPLPARVALAEQESDLLLASTSSGEARLELAQAALADKKHPEHRAMRQWAGRGYDPEKFDLAAVNKAIAKLARRRRSKRDDNAARL